jgi:hypothetical protein
MARRVGRVQLHKKTSGFVPQGAWCQDKLIGGHDCGHGLFYLSVGYCSIFSTNILFFAVPKYAHIINHSCSRLSNYLPLFQTKDI